MASILHILDRVQDRQFVNVHRILHRAAWRPRTGGRILLGLLIAAFTPSGPVIMELDTMIERRRGNRNAAKCIYSESQRRP